MSSISDETLLEKLAGDNLELRRELKRILGAESFEQAEPAAAAPAAPKPTVPSTPTTVQGLCIFAQWVSATAT